MPFSNGSVAVAGVVEAAEVVEATGFAVPGVVAKFDAVGSGTANGAPFGLYTDGPLEPRLSFAAALESGAPTADPLPGKAISGVEMRGALAALTGTVPIA